MTGCEPGPQPAFIYRKILLSGQIFLEELNRSLPCQLRIGFIIAWGRIIVETMIAVFINERGVGLVVRFQRGFIVRPAFIDALIQTGIMQ